MTSEFRVYTPNAVRIDNPADPLSREEAEELARDHPGAYMEVWHRHKRALVCAGRFAPGVYKPEREGSIEQAARFVREAVKQ